MTVLNAYLLTKILAVVFVILNILDGHSTYIVLRPNHYARERNPIAKWVFKKLGILPGIIIWKTLLLAVMIYLIFTQYMEEAYLLNIILLVANGFFTWVVIHNYKVYRRLKI
ncbi:MAG TPA: DUF5658 family protein [Candidatus Cloacimonadota bacterium]|nr:DUF5658 family protein [Candidatus Cloacimonadota bacterium]HPT71185.1 DUF5658 family protein [Candidatus Cloacimonadota bacterium]